MEERQIPRINEVKVYETLSQLSIDYCKYFHPPLPTVEAISEHIDHDDIHHCKNLFLRNAKGDQHYLLVVESDKVVNLRNIAQQIESTRLSFASPGRLEKYLGLEPGAVSPLGLINDQEKGVQVLIDEDLKSRERITFHPNINTVSVTMNYDDFQSFLRWKGNDVNYVKVVQE